MKKVFALILAVAMLATLNVGALAAASVPIGRVTVNTNPVVVMEGRTKQIPITIEPKGAVGELEWAVEDETVATVDQDGKVTGLKKNSRTNVTISVKGNSAVSCTVRIEVVDETANPIKIGITAPGTDPLKGSIKLNFSSYSARWVYSTPYEIVKVETKDGPFVASESEGKYISVTLPDGIELGDTKVFTDTLLVTLDDGKPAYEFPIELTVDNEVLFGVKVEGITGYPIVIPMGKDYTVVLTATDKGNLLKQPHTLQLICKTLDGQAADNLEFDHANMVLDGNIYRVPMKVLKEGLGRTTFSVYNEAGEEFGGGGFEFQVVAAEPDNPNPDNPNPDNPNPDNPNPDNPNPDNPNPDNPNPDNPNPDNPNPDNPNPDNPNPDNPNPDNPNPDNPNPDNPNPDQPAPKPPVVDSGAAPEAPQATDNAANDDKTTDALRSGKTAEVKVSNGSAAISVGTANLLGGSSGKLTLVNNGMTVVLPGGFGKVTEAGRVYFPFDYEQSPKHAAEMLAAVKTEGAKSEAVKAGGVMTLPTTATVTLKTKLTGTVNVYWFNEDTGKFTLIASPAAKDGTVTFATRQMGYFLLTTGRI